MHRESSFNSLILKLVLNELNKSTTSTTLDLAISVTHEFCSNRFFSVVLADAVLLAVVLSTVVLVAACLLVFSLVALLGSAVAGLAVLVFSVLCLQDEVLHLQVLLLQVYWPSVSWPSINWLWNHLCCRTNIFEVEDLPVCEGLDNFGGIHAIGGKFYNDQCSGRGKMII